MNFEKAEGRNRTLAVDCGRSSVKFSDGRDNKSFTSSYCEVDIAKLKAMPSLGKKKPMVVNYQDRTLIISELASSLFGAKESMSDDSYLQDSLLYYIVACGVAAAPSGDTFTLGINLTFNNMTKHKEEIRKALTGDHVISFYDFGKDCWLEKSFTIEKIGIVYQGWGALVDIVMDDYMELKEEFSDFYEKEGLILDFGRRTADVLHIKNLTPISGFSLNSGTFTVYQAVGDILRQEYGIEKSISYIEQRHYKGGGIPLLSGEVIDLQEIVQRVAFEVSLPIINTLRDRLSNATPDYVYLVGGGDLVFSEPFKKGFMISPLEGDRRAMNVKGLYKFFNRK